MDIQTFNGNITAENEYHIAFNIPSRPADYKNRKIIHC